MASEPNAVQSIRIRVSRDHLNEGERLVQVRGSDGGDHGRVAATSLIGDQEADDGSPA